MNQEFSKKFLEPNVTPSSGLENEKRSKNENDSHLESSPRFPFDISDEDTND